MYYELIKMLIDYERRNNPAAYDATKTVGKIEGYQELTNKLQMFLNHRFLLDIQKLSKTQEGINKAFGGDIESSNALQKLEKLEQDSKNMRERYTSLEETNKTLMYEISKLKERDADHKVYFDDITEKLEHFESVELSIKEANRNLIERVEGIELDGKKMEIEMRKLNNQQQSEMMKISDQTNNNRVDLKQIVERNKEINGRLETHEKVSKQTWQSVDATLAVHKETMNEIKGISTITEMKTKELKEVIFELSENLAHNAKATENNSGFIKDLNSKISAHQSLFQKMDFENMIEKIEQLEGAYHKHEDKIQGMDVVKIKVNLIEENKQQSDARLKNDMDETKRKNQNRIEKIRKEICEKVEKLDIKLETAASLHNDHVKSLQTEVRQSLQSSEGKVSAAEVHVENLRKLNRNLIDQMKEKAAAEQEITVEKLKIINEEFLSNLRLDIEKDVSLLVTKTCDSDTAIADLKNKTDILAVQVTTVVGNEEKIKEIVNTIESNQRMEQKSNEAYFSSIKSENKKFKKDIQEMKEATEVQERTCKDQIVSIKESCDKNHSQYAQTTTDQASMISVANEKLSAIIDTASKLMINCAAQDEKTVSLEKNSKDLDKKLLDLEAADLFLQESHKLLVERTDAAERKNKQFEENVTKMGEKQKTEIIEEWKKESKIILKRVDVLDLSCNRNIDETKKEKDKLKNHLESFKDDRTKISIQIENVQRQVSDDLSKLETQLKEQNLSQKNIDNQLKITTGDIENLYTTLNKLEPHVEKLAQKVVQLEKSLHDEMAVLANQSEVNRDGIETCTVKLAEVADKIGGYEKRIELEIKENIEEIDSKLKNLIQTISQQNDVIKKSTEENSNKHFELKDEIKTEKDILVKRIEDQKLVLTNIEKEFDTIKTTKKNEVSVYI